MKPMTLTNILLGIIAFCLVFNLLVNGNLITKAQAQVETKPNQPMEVLIVGVKHSGSLPVTVNYGGKNNPIAVNLVQVDNKIIKEATPIKVAQSR